MGCNSSKKEDIKHDRQRIATDENTNSAVIARSKPVGIIRKNSQDSGVDNIYSRSITDKRTEESDFLKNIIERTQQNFIYVSQNPQPLDEKESEKRVLAYQDQLSKQPLSICKIEPGVSFVKEDLSPLHLPKPTIPNFEQAVQMIDIVMYPATQRQLLSDTLVAVSAAVSAATVNSEDVLVVSFEDL